jgi:hypothetical protein
MNHVFLLVIVHGSIALGMQVSKCAGLCRMAVRDGVAELPTRDAKLIFPKLVTLAFEHLALDHGI